MNFSLQRLGISDSGLRSLFIDWALFVRLFAMNTSFCFSSADLMVPTQAEQSAWRRQRSSSSFFKAH